jgi:hypothetical protein
VVSASRRLLDNGIDYSKLSLGDAALLYLRIPQDLSRSRNLRLLKLATILFNLSFDHVIGYTCWKNTSADINKCISLAFQDIAGD